GIDLGQTPVGLTRLESVERWPMSTHSTHDQHLENATVFWRTRAFLAALVLTTIALVLLWQEHQGHILGALPYLLLLACPLLHLFGHCGSHHHHGDKAGDRGPPQELGRGTDTNRPAPG